MSGHSARDARRERSLQRRRARTHLVSRSDPRGRPEKPSDGPRSGPAASQRRHPPAAPLLAASSSCASERAKAQRARGRAKARERKRPSTQRCAHGRRRAGGSRAGRAITNLRPGPKAAPGVPCEPRGRPQTQRRPRGVHSQQRAARRPLASPPRRVSAAPSSTGSDDFAPPRPGLAARARASRARARAQSGHGLRACAAILSWFRGPSRRQHGSQQVLSDPSQLQMTGQMTGSCSRCPWCPALARAQRSRRGRLRTPAR